MSDNPLVIQSDRSILLETAHPNYEQARDVLARFAELEKSPEHVHTYRITPLSLWNSQASGVDPESILEDLERLSRYPVPENVRADVIDLLGRYGKLRIMADDDGGTRLESVDPVLLAEVTRLRSVASSLREPAGPNAFRIRKHHRGILKQRLLEAGFPAEDLAGYTEGAPLDVSLRETTRSGEPFAMRRYQREAVDAFHAGGSVRGGAGVVVLPCGAGKTIVGIGALSLLGTQTLILTANTSALRQWRDELLDKTTLEPGQIGEYSGSEKEIRPVTLSTYQLLTWRRDREAEFEHFGLFEKASFGLVIYDEVHLLPAPVFRATAELQARRRLGLTATLVREDGREDDVFTLIGPKRFDMPWKDLEKDGWIATASCTEVRLPLPETLRMEYAVSDTRAKFRIASTNPYKHEVLRNLLARHENDRILVIGQYLDQLDAIARETGAPILTGRTPQKERDRLYDEFRAGRIRLLIVSRVANFAIDLPDASVAIQVSGTFGSRQEEAQRLGRILRPKSSGAMARFYNLVTRDTREQEFARNRQRFLTEQGYQYAIEHVEPEAIAS